jgi:hypothetical protein
MDRETAWDAYTRREARRLIWGQDRGVVTADERAERLRFFSQVTMLFDPLHRAAIRARLTGR